MISPRDFLAIAKRLATQSDEIDKRCSMSRAYYAIFHALVFAQRRLELPLGEGNSHERIINAFLNSDNSEYVLLGTKANQAKQLRVRADYYLRKKILASDVQAQLVKAERVLNSIEVILKKAS